jgi:hypothetical protein
MLRAQRDPERGRAVAVELKRLGAKRILVKAAEQGYITELACGMPQCFCPEELGGAGYFDPVTAKEKDWTPTLEHFPVPKRDGGREAADNAILAHRLCNRSTTPSLLAALTRGIWRGSGGPARRRPAAGTALSLLAVLGDARHQWLVRARRVGARATSRSAARRLSRGGGWWPDASP